MKYLINASFSNWANLIKCYNSSWQQKLKKNCLEKVWPSDCYSALQPTIKGTSAQSIKCETSVYTIRWAHPQHALPAKTCTGWSNYKLAWSECRCECLQNRCCCRIRTNLSSFTSWRWCSVCRALPCIPRCPAHTAMISSTCQHFHSSFSLPS